MSATPRPSQKKQATLTSFFTPKSASGHGSGVAANATNDTATSSPSAAPPSSSPGAALAPSQPALVSRKRPLEDEVDQNKRAASRGGSRSRTARASKRPRSDKGSDEENADVRGAAGDGVPEAARSSPLRSSGRTERYIYDGRSAAGADAADEDDSEDDPETRRRKAELHHQFVKKLGRPDSLFGTRRRDFMRGGAAGGGGGRGDEDQDDKDGEDADEDDGDEPASKTLRKKAPGKLTPMEQQFLAIKRQHMDTVLVVEVGYKFRFLGEDARTAARVLGIMCIPGKVRYDEHASEAHLERFASASIPVPRLPVHVKRLVAAGLKVGVVRQMETAALKKAGDNRNAPFVRQLTNVYTKGTYVDEVEVLGGPEGAADAKAPPPPAGGGHLLCLTESPTQGTGTDETVQIGILAVQPATGDIVYDAFADGFLRSELETRLLHIAPCELLVVGSLSRATEKLVTHLAAGGTANVFGDCTRVERVPRAATAAAAAYSHVTQFYGNPGNGDGDGDGDGEHGKGHHLQTVLGLPENVTVCLSAMITHLAEYGLQHIFDLTKYFASFTSRQHMLLSGTTLESLEVYRNATDHGLRGSLLWALDKTATRCGHRLLRRWIGRPLLDRGALLARQAAVAELAAAAGSARRDALERLLATTKTDLERSLIRIYYGKCTRPELVAVLQTLQRISAPSSSSSASSSASSPPFAAPLVASALAALPAIHADVVAVLGTINGDAARRDDKYAFFRDAHETDAITTHKLGIAAVEMELDEHRAEIARALAKPLSATSTKYCTVAGIEYLVEVPNTDLRRVPASWIKVSGTKRCSRFHTPAVVRLLGERDQHKEALAAACDAAFAALLADLAARCYQPLRDAVAALATLDALLSLARVASLPGYCQPTILPAVETPGEGARIEIRDGRHPVAEHILPSGYIPFSTALGGHTDDCPRALLITGPNMGGKSSFVRAVALLTLMAQVGAFVPAAAMRLTLADAIHTRMGARDNLFAGESTFMVEVSETAAILRAATPRSLVVLDELGRGTSTHDGAAIAQAVLEHVARDIRCLTLFITHYQSLSRVADALGPRAVRNVHMRFSSTKGSGPSDHANPAGAPPEEITFLYEVAPGVAHRSYGLNVARLAHIPPRVLDLAACKSREMEDDVRRRRLQAAARLLGDVLAPAVHASPRAASTDQLDHLVASIEQL